MRWLCCLALALLPIGLTANDIVFVDENVKALCVGKWDTDGNGELSEEEAAAVTTLGRTFAFKSQILSFDELKYFTGLTYLDQYEFMNCSGLQCVTIPSGVTTLKEKAFYGCSSLLSIDIPGSVSVIGELAFDACSHLEEVKLHEGLQEIKDMAFYYCGALTRIHIPASLTKVALDAFGHCDGLTMLTVDPDNKEYDSRDDCNAIIKKNTNTLLLGCQSSIVPESVTAIGAGAFNGCTKLTSISIPSSVTAIHDMAFNGCKGLKEVSIPSTVTSLGCGAFWGCTSLTSIVLPEGMSVISEHAFDGCYALKEVTLPSTTTKIGSDAFFGCSRLKSVTVLFTTPLPIIASTFSSRRSATLYVPLGSIADFKNADVWKDFKSIVEWFPMGDVNHDGSVNVLDVTLVIDYILDKKPENFHYEEANVNGDEYINVLDVTKIIDIILGK